MLAAWTGPIQRHRDPAELAQILLGLDTPSLFEAPALVLVHASDKYLNKQRDATDAASGPSRRWRCVVLVQPKSCRRVMRWRKRRKRRGRLQRIEVPQRPADVRNWLVGRLHQLCPMALSSQVPLPKN